MDLKDMAIQMLMKKIGGVNDPKVAESALGELLGGGDKFNIGDIVGKFAGAGGAVADKTKSWLGDGANDSISTSQLQDVIGGDKIEAFATKLGIDPEEASGGLAEFLPQLIDKSSSDGSLLESLGGAGGLAGLASKFLK